MKLAFALLLGGVLLPASQAFAATSGLKEGAVSLKSAGPITFSPDGILFVADSKAAAIVAIDTQDSKAAGNLLHSKSNR